METKIHKNIFIDSEFNNFKDLKPISIGLISEYGKDELYLEFNDVERSTCSDFVIATVLPILDGDKKPRIENISILHKWIDSLNCSSISFIADYMGDIYILSELLKNETIQTKLKYVLLEKEFIENSKLLGYYNHKLMSKAFEKMLHKQEELFKANPHLQHHALFDAYVNKESWIYAANFLKR